jgi:hypothetical protein
MGNRYAHWKTGKLKAELSAMMKLRSDARKRIKATKSKREKSRLHYYAHQHDSGIKEASSVLKKRLKKK